MDATLTDRLGAAGVTYAAAHDASDGAGLDFFTVQSSYVGEYYYVDRGFLSYDTSSLSGKAISGATVTLKCYSSPVQTDTGQATIHLVEGVHGSSVVAADFGTLKNKIVSGGSTAYSALNAGDDLVITLNSTGLEWINKTGTTKFGLRVDGDIENDTPTGYNWWFFYGYGVTLAVTYLDPTPRLLSFDCRGVWYPTIRNIINCTVLCADGLATRNGTDDGQTGAVIKAAIEEARDTATWPITFYDRDGNTIYVKVLSAKYRATSDTKDKNPEGVFDLVLMKVPLS